MRRDISKEHPEAQSTDTINGDVLELDAIIVGAGFGGSYMLKHLRDDLGMKAKIFEAGSDIGGIWHWNCYPGARVDSDVPVYEFSDPNVWGDWYWTERFPGYKELRAYFEHAEKKMQIRKDTIFDSKVVDAAWDGKVNKWTVRTEKGRVAKAQYLIVATGFAAKRHFPDWPGLDKFEGIMHHPSFWPAEGIDVKGKKVAVVGTGATGVQLSQELAKQIGEDGSLTVFQRTPNLAIPMQQRKLTKEEQDEWKNERQDWYTSRMTTFAGFLFDFQKTPLTFEHTPEQREEFYEKLWQKGGFNFWIATYDDMLKDKAANEEAYKFWAKKTRARIQDPRKRDILAPETAPHAFGTKRPSLEQDYYEQFNKPNVDVIDLKANPVKEVVADGIITEDGTHHKLDVLALATGFDSVTGGMKNMGLKDKNGVDLRERWANGTFTSLGLFCDGFPNMAFLYAAQAPTAFSNGVSTVECQGEYLVKLIKQLREQGVETIEPTHESVEAWRKEVTKEYESTLFPGTSSWYNGGNVPGKPREQLNYLGGMPAYHKNLHQTLPDLPGFETVKSAA
ncbi:MAG: hypothetical protein GOMPHAMPRED_004533 [Gomphillus americanus]|uniref:FAD/NAD(P)-binding domain-containing protein n=1 Tax=Gomphillus americanus TaxID=1940652 RepID=A0A8H3FMM8_9LECA|nr:MAG: hypothetical protein GOMPHAMPRED_004533 [Gomphillus americanus]